MINEDDYISVLQIRDYAYCPRVVYFRNVLHIEERLTEAMLYGREKHEEFSLAPLIPKLKPVKIIENVELISHRLRIKGKVDIIIITRYNEYIPVEIKWSELEKGMARRQHKAQIIAYALLIEDNFNTTVKRGLIYYSRSKKFSNIIITESDKRLIKNYIVKIYEIYKERIPKDSQNSTQCKDCGYNRYCQRL